MLYQSETKCNNQYQLKSKKLCILERIINLPDIKAKIYAHVLQNSLLPQSGMAS